MTERALPRRRERARAAVSSGRSRLAAPAGLTALALCLLLGITLGPVGIAPDVVLEVLLNRVLGTRLEVDATSDAIVWSIRLPRVLLAAAVGATLGVSGAAYQAVFRNPLADPYLLGVAAGAGLAATLATVLGAPQEYANVSVVTLAAFAGALAAVLLTYSLARVSGHAPATTLILAGVAISSIAVSVISYLMLVTRESTSTILTWLLGGFNRAGWGEMAFILPYAVPAALVIYAHGRLLNVLQLDEAEARQVGVDVERTRLVVLAAASLAAASAVAVAGIVGFVGLIAPHAVRLVVGPDYRRLIPLVAVAGACFLVLADLGARTLMDPGEIPLGVITALVGAPFFLYLLRRQRKVFF